MRVGDLVRVRWGGSSNPDSDLGEVLNYRPDVHGGSWVLTWKNPDGSWRSRIHTADRRGEVLVFTYRDGGTSWWDEVSVEEIKERENGL